MSTARVAVDAKVADELIGKLPDLANGLPAASRQKKPRLSMPSTARPTVTFGHDALRLTRRLQSLPVLNGRRGRIRTGIVRLSGPTEMPQKPEAREKCESRGAKLPRPFALSVVAFSWLQL